MNAEGAEENAKDAKGSKERTRSVSVELVGKNDLPRGIEVMSHHIIGCAMEVHTHLGPGLLERLYEDAMEYELRRAGLRVERQVEITVPYKDTILRGQRLDMLVGRLIVVELKSVAQIADVHKAQLLSYLRAGGFPLGLLFNFNVASLRHGMRRVLNERSTIVQDHRSPVPTPSIPSRPSRSRGG